MIVDLGDDHVAVVRSDIPESDVSTAVAGARSKGLHLSVVSIGDDITDDDTSAITKAVFLAVDGTVLVLSPTSVYSRSSDITDAAVHAANSAAAKAPNDLAAVKAFIAAALAGVGAATTSAKPTATGKTKTTAPTTVNGVTIADVVNALAKDHVAIEDGVTGVDRAALVALASRARKNSLNLSIVILAADVTGHLSDVAGAIGDSVPGTVLVMSPSRVALASDSVSQKALQKALDAASAATDSSYLASATAMVNSLVG